METLINPSIRDFKKIIVKIGSSLLVGESNQLQSEWLDSVCDDIAEMHKRGQSVIIVTSGAISAGVESLGLNKSGLSVIKLLFLTMGELSSHANLAGKLLWGT